MEPGARGLARAGQAAQLKERVEKLAEMHLAGLHDAVYREVGQLRVAKAEYQDSYTRGDLMIAIAARIMPEGWEWEVIGMLDGTAHLIVKGYREPKPVNDSCHCGDCVDCGGL